MISETCENCRFWIRNTGGDTRVGSCRLLPPVIVAIDDDSGRRVADGRVPNTRDVDFCGSYRRAEVVETPIDEAMSRGESDD